jgi:hypothetical protein
MNAKRDIESRERRRSPQLRVITVVFIILFTAMCYLLTRSMVRHHFSGSGKDYNLRQH